MLVLLHWRTVAWCGNSLPALAALALFFIHESPVWLLRHNKLDKALKSLTFLRHDFRPKELNEMQRLSKEKATTKQMRTSSNYVVKEWPLSHNSNNSAERVNSTNENEDNDDDDDDDEDDDDEDLHLEKNTRYT
ncbi:hypothetical protein EVAR_73378_1 [Eumeta japonica]|uniref:Uncharacterized protein n=1 Tax=Eumeta variegata TaxID=151549 RepID=A0A4C1SMV8_EUMVA|nr:hypothetical protein EVAR_73378_1 [Eumeta japonica]